MGVGFNVRPDTPFELASEAIIDKVKSIWTDPVFTKNSGQGVRASIRIPKIIPMGRSLFAK